MDMGPLQVDGKLGAPEGKLPAASDSQHGGMPPVSSLASSSAGSSIAVSEAQVSSVGDAATPRLAAVPLYASLGQTMVFAIKVQAPAPLPVSGAEEGAAASAEEGAPQLPACSSPAGPSAAAAAAARSAAEVQAVAASAVGQLLALQPGHADYPAAAVRVQDAIQDALTEVGGPSLSLLTRPRSPALAHRRAAAVLWRPVPAPSCARPCPSSVPWHHA